MARTKQTTRQGVSVPSDLYWGRKQIRGGLDLLGTKWYNPHLLYSGETLEDFLKQYEVYVRSRGLVFEISELRSMRLRCLSISSPCNVLSMLIDELNTIQRTLIAKLEASNFNMSVDDQLVQLESINELPMTNSQPTKQYVSTLTFDLDEIRMNTGNLGYALANQGSVLYIVQADKQHAYHDEPIFQQSNVSSAIKALNQGDHLLTNVSIFLNDYGEFLTPHKVSVLVIAEQPTISKIVAVASDYDFVIADDPKLDIKARIAEYQGVVRCLF